MKLHDRVLFFPVTPFGPDPDDGVQADVLAELVTDRLVDRPGGVFVACGTGEFHAMDGREHDVAVRAAVEAVDGQVPVVAGAGGPLPLARTFARQAQAAGADGLLLMPPYLVGGSTDGMVAYAEQVAASSELPIVLYQRSQVRYTTEAIRRLANNPRIVGLKDGTGDFDLVQRLVLALREELGGEVGDGFTLFNGLPTAEFTAAAYLGLGVDRYSSAAFCFIPEVANAFHTAYLEGDSGRQEELLNGFYAPLVRLRDQVPGYAISLVKAGVRLRGLDAGSVRAPLTDPTPEHLDELEKLITVGLDLVGHG